MQKSTAALLQVSTRTLRSWKKNSNRPSQKQGRKKVGVTLAEQLAVGREWERQGCPGYRAVRKSLPNLRERMVREAVAGLKFKKRQRYERKREQVRTSVVVHQAGTVGAMDAAAVSKGDEFIVYRDRGSLKMKTNQSDGFTKSNDTLKVLGKMKEDGNLPLVVGTDNGPPFCAKPVEDFLTTNQVVHLKSLPYVPQHNGSAENAVGEIKRLRKDGVDLAVACFMLNQNRRRQKLNWQTSNEMEQRNITRPTSEERERFYYATQAAIKAAVIGTESAKEKRKAEREAIFQTMESFSLITRTRGRQCA